jgi:orotidine-5'-phosphate decarboxylase
MIVDLLARRIAEKSSPIVLGLDPQQSLLPTSLLERQIQTLGETPQAVAAAYLEFGKAILDACHDLVPAVKLQSACYEAYGSAGMETMRELLHYAHNLDLICIADAKRGDIGSTSAQYSSAFLGRVMIGNTPYTAFPSDAVTVNPYLGSDNLNEFLTDADSYDKMVFVLCKTSNPSSSELQDLKISETTLYQTVARLMEKASVGRIGESGYSRVGIVVGATHPEHLVQLRQEFPHLFFLIPGYGAQGGSAKDLAGGFDSSGGGAIVNNSRGILAAWKKSPEFDFPDAARRAVIQMKQDLSSEIPKRRFL